MLSTRTLAIAATLSVLALLIFSDFAPVPTALTSADGSQRQEVKGTVNSMRSAGSGLMIELEDASGPATIYCKSEGVSTALSVGGLAVAVITGSGDDGLLFASSVRPL